jgi:transcriptional regulator with XRE-family HTH domain
VSPPANTGSPGESVPLGLELRKLRQVRGLSQSSTAGLLGLSSRSAIADYESGRRRPPNDILVAYERAFGLPPRCLQDLRVSHLAERAEIDYQDAITRAARREPARDASPDEAPEPAVGKHRRLWLRPVIGLTAIALIAVSGDAHARNKSSLDPTWTENNQHVSDRSERRSPTENMDGDDPRARDCFADATVVQAVPFRMPDDTPGTLRLRHSNHCGASWASAYYSNPKLYTVRLAAYRPSDGAEVHSEWSNNTPPGSYGDMLSTATGCVWVEVSVVTRTGATRPVRTDCQR